jgi:hypothetical protein
MSANIWPRPARLNPSTVGGRPQGAAPDHSRVSMIDLSLQVVEVGPVKGADTPLWAATSPELNGVTGKALSAHKQVPAKFTEPGPIAELQRRCVDLEQGRRATAATRLGRG